ncbi:BatA domain-containing protein [Crateriforma conspicua]|uniref:Aerotolerance regulator N-terminal domain-containing protein n=1 Tax=Crateriforma conspicua TaxID=2527996 RepID=A0A5C5Y952_9PLAN|nr:BatA domain-containing protein [Crateriforma conspicua]TWT72216.1 hypothetical protein Pan14r_45340 [Crateriforma conspicua]
MTFVNATLILGTLAVAVPIALHLIAPKQPRRESFPTVRFLTQRFESNRTRLKVKRWWLLALRILALAALAIALAGPLVRSELSTAWLAAGIGLVAGLALLGLATASLFRGMSKPTIAALAISGAIACAGSIGWAGFSLLASDAPVAASRNPIALAILLDNGPSSQWTAGGTNHLDAIRAAAKKLVGRVAPGSRVVIADRSSRPVVFATDTAAAINQIENVRVRPDAAPISGKLDAMLRLLGNSDLEDRHLVIVSNLSRSSWTTPPQQALVDDRVAVSVLDVGNFDASNRSLKLLHHDPHPPLGQATAVRGTITVQDSAGERSDTATVELVQFADDPTRPLIRDGVRIDPETRVVDRAVVSIANGRSSEFVVTLPPQPDLGIRHGMIRLGASDALAADDQRFLSWSIQPRRPLLIVSQDPDQADLIAWAATSPLAPDDPNSAFQVDVIGEDVFPTIDRSRFDAVIFLDPSASLLAAVDWDAFFSRGSAAAIIAGPRLAGGFDQHDVLPTFKRVWKVPSPGSFLEIVRPGHQIFDELASLDPQPRWSDFRIRRYWQIKSKKNQETLASYAGTDHPAIIAMQRDQGRLAVMTTPLAAGTFQADRWNDLFGSDAWPTFILTRQLVRWLATPKVGTLQARVGLPFQLSLSALNKSPAGSGANARSEISADEIVRWQLFSPRSDLPTPIETASDAPRLTVGQISQVGTYWLRSPRGTLGFSSNWNGDDLIAEKASVDDLTAWLGPEGDETGFTLTDDLSDIELIGTKGAASISLRSPILLLAVIAFILEQVLGNRFYRPAKGAQLTPGIQRLAGDRRVSA